MASSEPTQCRPRLLVGPWGRSSGAVALWGSLEGTAQPLICSCWIATRDIDLNGRLAGCVRQRRFGSGPVGVQRDGVQLAGRPVRNAPKWSNGVWLRSDAVSGQPGERSYFHHANDAIAERARRIAPDEPWVFVCECGHCMEDVRLTIQEFESLRAKGLPLLRPGHQRDGLEQGPALLSDLL